MYELAAQVQLFPLVVKFPAVLQLVQVVASLHARQPEEQATQTPSGFKKKPVSHSQDPVAVAFCLKFKV